MAVRYFYNVTVDQYYIDWCVESFYSNPSIQAWVQLSSRFEYLFTIFIY